MWMDQRVELYYSKNGTVEIVSHDSPPPIFSFFITIFCYLLGISHNLIVLSAVLSEKKLRTSSSHQMLALVSLTCLFDCLTNESFAVGLLLNNAISWCSLSAAIFTLVLLIQPATLVWFCLERTFTLYKVPLVLETCVLAQLSACLFGLLFTLPLSADSEVHYFRNRNSCGTVQRNYWAPTLFLLGILISWTCHAIYLTIRTRRKHHQLTSFSPIPVSSLSEEQNSSVVLAPDPVTRICSSVLFLYVVLLAPQTVFVAVTLFLQLDLEPDPWLDPREPRDHETRSVHTVDLELLLTYLRYMYNVAVPVVMLSTDTSVRNQARRVFCCATNTVTNDPAETASSTEMKHITMPSYKTPVLFSTPQGIHLRLAAHQDVTSPDGSITLITRFCDLTNEPENASSSMEESSRRPEEQWNVRFSSKVDVISPTGTMTRSDSGPRCSDTHRVLNPVLVRGIVESNKT